MSRKSTVIRETKETQIQCMLELDGAGKSAINSGVGFLDHMLDLFTFHSKVNLDVKAIGDLHVDGHHLIEDTGICIGKMIDEALADRRGIRRYASCYLTMDETLSRTAIDFSGRFYHVIRADFSGNSIGQFPTEMISHFFYSVAVQCGLTLHQEVLYGSNDHHKCESLFKGFGRALREAVLIEGKEIPSTKGKI